MTIALCALAPARAADETGDRFSPVNQYGISGTAAYWNPIIAWVSDKSGVPLQLKIGRTAAETTANMLAQEVAFIFSSHMFSPEREQLGWTIFGHRLTLPVRGQVIVAADSPVTDLAVYRQTQRMVAILNELLDLARIEARRGSDFRLQTLGLAQLVRDVVPEFQPPDGRDPPTLAHLPVDLLVRLDRDKLHQALGNVLSNAYKVSPTGGAVEVDLLPAAPSGEAGAPARPPLRGIRVTDHGIGMTPEQLSRVSERFYRADASGNIPGTGLGMSIVKEIDALLGGQPARAGQRGHAVAAGGGVAHSAPTRSQWAPLN
jgi:signal transduction histidine kinase